MMISTKGRYALRFLVDIAEHQAEGYVPLKDVAERQGISEKYLESIVKTLVRADVLTGLRGKGGGYRLRKSPDQYGVREILSLLEGPLVPVACLGPGDQSCDRMTSCRTLPLWQGLEQVIQEYLDKYRADCLTPGNQVQLITPTSRREAYAVEIDDQFRLVVEFPDGTRQALSAGEVSVRGMYGYV